ncbi:MAG: L-lactate dehydrogenase [Lachnospiraceae bacterium]|nr:L-lactate dehydrogenase [Lachnospiraceae bacterium]
MKKVKIGIIGIGNVGSHVLYTLALQGLADEFVLIDINEKKAAADRQDTFDSAMFLPHKVKITVAHIAENDAGDGKQDQTTASQDTDGFALLRDCDIIINSVGQIDLLRVGHDRFTELKFNIPAVRSYAGRIAASGFNGIIVNISNPCDVITHELIRLIPLPKGRIFGTGTGLDTARLRAALADKLNVSVDSIVAYMFGEHGSHQITPWSIASFDGIPLDVMEKLDPRFSFDREKAEHAAAEGGWVTYYGKFHTEFAISLTASRIVKAIIYDEKAVLPASCLLEGQYGEHDVCAGVPAVIGAGGVELIPELPITDEEKTRFHECCEVIRANIARAAELN